MRQQSSPTTITLITLILVFLLVLVFIWLWYDVKIKALETSKGKNISMQILQNQPTKTNV